MSWMDSALNIAKYAMSWTEHMLVAKPGVCKTKVWVGQPHEELWGALGSSTSWTDFQKKMGLVSYCCLRQDSEALNLEALCYRKGDTPRT